MPKRPVFHEMGIPGSQNVACVCMRTRKNPSNLYMEKMMIDKSIWGAQVKIADKPKWSQNDEAQMMTSHHLTPKVECFTISNCENLKWWHKFWQSQMMTSHHLTPLVWQSQSHWLRLAHVTLPSWAHQDRPALRAPHPWSLWPSSSWKIWRKIMIPWDFWGMECTRITRKWMIYPLVNVDIGGKKKQHASVNQL